jgi:hypothetical protein
MVERVSIHSIGLLAYRRDQPLKSHLLMLKVKGNLVKPEYGCCPHVNNSQIKIPNDQTSELLENTLFLSDSGGIHLTGLVSSSWLAVWGL